MKLIYLLLPLLFILLSCSGEAPEILEYSVVEVTNHDEEPNLRVVKFKCVLNDDDKDCNKILFNNIDQNMILAITFDTMEEEVDTFYFDLAFRINELDTVTKVRNIIIAEDEKNNNSATSDTITLMLK